MRIPGQRGVAEIELTTDDLDELTLCVMAAHRCKHSCYLKEKP
jgi:hypothetical protein